MYSHEINILTTRVPQTRQQCSETLVERAQAFLDTRQGTPESRDIILGLLLANAQLQDIVKLAEKIIEAAENGDMVKQIGM